MDTSILPKEIFNDARWQIHKTENPLSFNIYEFEDKIFNTEKAPYIILLENIISSQTVIFIHNNYVYDFLVQQNKTIGKTPIEFWKSYLYIAEDGSYWNELEGNDIQLYYSHNVIRTNNKLLKFLVDDLNKILHDI